MKSTRAGSGVDVCGEGNKVGQVNLACLRTHKFGERVEERQCAATTQGWRASIMMKCSLPIYLML